MADEKNSNYNNNQKIQSRTYYSGVFWVADYEFEVRILKFSDPRWRMRKITTIIITKKFRLEHITSGFFGSLIMNLRSEFSNFQTQNGGSNIADENNINCYRQSLLTITFEMHHS